MTTDDATPPDSTSASGPRDSNGLLGAQDGTAHENPSVRLGPELDDPGVPLVGQSAQGRLRLGAIASLVCGVLSAALCIMALKYHAVRNVPRWLTWTEGAAGVLAASLAIAILGLIENKKLKLGAAWHYAVVAAAVLGFMGFIIWAGLIDPNWHGQD